MPTSYLISPPTTNADEGAGIVGFTVNRSGDLPAETVYLSTLQSEGATNSGDYVGLFNMAITFAAGQFSRNFTIAIINDGRVEAPETFAMILQRNASDPTSTRLAKSTFTIIDNDGGVSGGGGSPTMYEILPLTTVTMEHEGRIGFTVNRHGNLPAETVYVSTAQSAGFANSGDYTGLTDLAITFSAGQNAANFQVAVHNDQERESDERFALIVQRSPSAPVSNYVARSTFTLQDDDRATSSLVQLLPASDQTRTTVPATSVTAAPVTPLLGDLAAFAAQLHNLGELSTIALERAASASQVGAARQVAEATGLSRQLGALASVLSLADSGYTLAHGLGSGSAQEVLDGLSGVSGVAAGLVRAGSVNLGLVQEVARQSLAITDAISSGDALRIATAVNNAVVISSFAALGYIASGGSVGGAAAGTSLGNILLDNSNAIGELIGSTTEFNSFVDSIPGLRAALGTGGATGIITQATQGILDALPGSVRALFTLTSAQAVASAPAALAKSHEGLAAAPVGLVAATPLDGLMAAVNVATTYLLGQNAANVGFVQGAHQQLLRTPIDLDRSVSLGELLTQDPSLLAGIVRDLVAEADATTSVATLTYQFFTGKIPSLDGIDYLVSPSGPNPNNLNSGYYQSFNLENRYINFAVNLGKLGEGRVKFEVEYGGLSLIEATKKAYGMIFGLAPTDAKVAALLSGGRDLYFETYGQDGHDGIGTKAAMVGWLLAEAEKADLGVYARSNAAFLTDLADGAPWAVDLVGVYGRPEYVYGG